MEGVSVSYKALYRKYRPSSFEEVVGQEHIINTLKNIILTRKIGHAYLFSGPKGSGKTSLANIFANVLNCMHTENLTQACNVCKSKIGKSLDIIEMDAASNNGVDEIRDLKEKIEQSPINSRFKIYIIDEVHMLTKSAFNALLKTLEEPPAHAIFIFATTDHQKIPLTILSRVQRFNFSKLTIKQIYDHLTKVLNKEGIKYTPEALKMIARLSGGAMRDALSIADQSASFGVGEITLKNLSLNFGITSNDLVIQLINLVYIKETKQALKLFYFLKKSGADANQLVVSLINLLKEWSIYRFTASEEFLEWLTQEELQSLKISYDFALEFLEKLNDLLVKISRAEQPFELLEILILKMVAFENTQSFLVEASNRANYSVDESLENKIEPKNIIENKQQVNLFTKVELPDQEHNWGLIKEQPTQLVKPQPHLQNQAQQPDFFQANEMELASNFVVEQSTFTTQAVEIEREISQEINLLENAINKTNEFMIMDNEEEANSEDLDAEVNSFNENTIETNLYHTQEIDLSEDKSTTKYYDLSENSTQNIAPLDKYTDKWNDQEIANLLHIIQQNIQVNTKDNFSTIKNLSENTISASETEKYKKMKLLEPTKILASSDTFILLTSDDESILNQIYQVRNTEDFQKYINSIFNGYKHIYLTSPEQRKRAYNLFKNQLNAQIIPNDLEKISPLVKLENRFKDKSIESKAKMIFGNAIKLMKRGNNE